MNFQPEKAIENYEKFISRSKKRIEVDKTKDIMAQMNTEGRITFYQKMSEARNQIETKQLENAEETLNQAVDMDPTNAKVYELLARLQEISGDHEKAIEWRKRLLELAPEDALAIAEKLEAENIEYEYREQRTAIAVKASEKDIRSLIYEIGSSGLAGSGRVGF